MKTNKFIIGIVGVVTATFSIFLPTDPDLGFHLRIGERFWKFHQIPHSNCLGDPCAFSCNDFYQLKHECWCAFASFIMAWFGAHLFWLFRIS